MPSYYEVSPTDDALKLKDGRASAGFTVRYVGDRQVEARATANAVQGAESSWLEVEPPSTKRMEPNETQTFKIAVNVPKGTPAGRYGLRLDVLSVDNPDEEYDRGPVVSFEVAETKPEPEPSGFPWWIVVVVALVLALLIGLGVWWWLSGDDGGGRTVVPPVEEEAGEVGVDPDDEEEAGVPAAAQVFREGSLLIRQTFVADLDAGTTGGQPGADIWFEARTADERFITPRNGARIASVGRRLPDHARCAGADLSRESIPLDRLPVGSHVCVRTSAGRLARFRVNTQASLNPDVLQINFTTWERQ